MAILEPVILHKGTVEVTIEVGGQGLKEYDVPKDCKVETKTSILIKTIEDAFTVTLDAKRIPHVIKYVESMAGKPIGFRFRADSLPSQGCDHLAIQVQCDGASTPLKHLFETGMSNGKS
ncbi:hypothetical protein PG999_010213 [Apiospora kogelbergensis]|uniref:Uncharacterized protein n=1 Tax=Apiospora kogelbergensis TaxID=1337665 RepID=A0AAW0QJD7_9PEZI